MKLAFLGSAMLGFALFMVFAGFPKQIWNQHKTKVCGMSLAVALPAFGVYATRALYVAIKDQDWFLMAPDVCGAVFSLIILLQYVKYRSKPPESK